MHLPLLHDNLMSWADPVGGRGGPPSGKSQVAIGFLRNTGMDSPREAIGPFGRSVHGPLRNTLMTQNKLLQGPFTS